MATAEAVARYFPWLAAQEPESDPLTLARLQRPLYLAQGWSLGGRMEPLFADTIAIAEDGPVVARLAVLFAASGWLSPAQARSGMELHAAERALLNWVWAHYGGYTGARLRLLAAIDPPLDEARRRGDGLHREDAGALWRVARTQRNNDGTYAGRVGRGARAKCIRPVRAA